ncbi:MAG: hypothetical protein CVV62_01765 [Tenericutes bacterium HGW-Tenericutes-7]|nr:MAG: hypothetical protein CVV62_01765 [Tenericutes bacterium HGW-Tenericutes-7]
MKNLKRRNVVLVLLVLFALAVSGTTYAYWASSVNGVQETVNNEINIGQGDAVTINVDITDPQTFTDKLVPNTPEVTAGAGETKSIVVSYSVTWNNDALLDGVADQAISAVVSNIQVGGVANPYSLITVTPGSNPTTIGMGDTVVFTFTVTMAEPGNVTEYNAVANQAITFDITFDIA